MRDRVRSRAIGLRTRCARPPTRGRYSTCDCRTSTAKVCVRLARSCALLDAEELRDGRASSRRSMRDDGRCSTHGGARDIAQHCDVEAPLHAGLAAGGRRLASAAGRTCAPHDGARWPRDARLRRACRAQNRGGGAGRPPLRRVSGDIVTACLISSRVWFGPVPGSP
ncbi:hypothetical protein F511_09140 [Dorcoceras hygrometricum]|uniref:Uncharacterized protein n=1 Tax=Dorcoceras hygrometricum TaxID=472368 RepID=A0A2Z7AS23_9LAMI|nr:hypothetical protein F511_09140 [Dorcoceras hygrometricum]